MHTFHSERGHLSRIALAVFLLCSVPLVLALHGGIQHVDTFAVIPERSVALAAAVVVGDTTVANCASECLGLYWCYVFTYHRATGECSLLDSTQYDDGELDTVPTEYVVGNAVDTYVKKIPDGKGFQRQNHTAPDAALSPSDSTVHNTLEECIDHCKDTYWCRGFSFARTDGRCSFYAQTGITTTPVVGIHMYLFTNGALNVSGYDRTEGAQFLFPCEVEESVTSSTAAECASLCSSTYYWCKTFDYDPDAGQCRLCSSEAHEELIDSTDPAMQLYQKNPLYPTTSEYTAMDNVRLALLGGGASSADICWELLTQKSSGHCTALCTWRHWCYSVEYHKVQSNCWLCPHKTSDPDLSLDVDSQVLVFSYIPSRIPEGFTQTVGEKSLLAPDDTVMNVTVLECGARCRDTWWCLSFDYSIAVSMCRMFETVPTQAQRTGIEDNSWEFYQWYPDARIPSGYVRTERALAAFPTRGTSLDAATVMACAEYCDERYWCTSFNYNRFNGTCVFGATTADVLPPQIGEEGSEYDYYEKNTTIAGCTDSSASNYYLLALVDDGSCTYSEHYFGCTDTSALNYDELALFPDDTCVYPLCFENGGCGAFGQCVIVNGTSQECVCDIGLQGELCNEYPDFLVTVGAYLPGNVDHVLFNISLDECAAHCSTIDDSTPGSCLSVDYYYNEPLSYCYVSSVTADSLGSPLTQNTKYVYLERDIVYGCTDPTSQFYDSFAERDDGSCFDECPPEVNPCGKYSACYILADLSLSCECNSGFSGTYCNEFPMYEFHSNQYLPGNNDIIRTGFTLEECASLCTGLSVDDSGPSCLSFDYESQRGVCYISSTTAPALGITLSPSALYDHFEKIIVAGCMDSTASNYNPVATYDDGTMCQYPASCDSFTNCSRYSECWVSPIDLQTHCNCSFEHFEGTFCDQHVFYNYYENRYLPGNNYQILTETTVAECLTACSSMNSAGELCYSVDYEHGSNVCYISLVSSEDVGIALAVSSLFDHFDRKFTPGCTDTGADNYDSAAIVDDGSCSYPQGDPCNEAGVRESCGNNEYYGTCLADTETVASPEATCICKYGFQGTSCDEYMGYLIYYNHYLPGSSDVIFAGVTVLQCMEHCETYTDASLNFCRSFDYERASGTCFISFHTGDELGTSLLPLDIFDHFDRLEDGNYGCTDPSALNYNSSAFISDGSCEYVADQTCPTGDEVDFCGHRGSYGHCEETDGRGRCVCTEMYFGGALCREVEGYSAFYDRALPGNNDHIVYNVSASQCLDECSDRSIDAELCLSVDYNRADSICYLSFSTQNTTGEELMVTTAFDHFERLQREGCTDTNAVNYDNRAFVEDGSCYYAESCPTEGDSNPCGPYGVCFIDSINGYRTCHCLAEFSGANCTIYSGYAPRFYHYLPGSNQMVIPHCDLACCAARCSESDPTQPCLSFDHKRTEDKCYLNGNATAASDGPLAPGAEFDHFERLPSELTYGCSDPLSPDYSPLVSIDDGSCTYDSCPEGQMVECGMHGRYGSCVLDPATGETVCHCITGFSGDNCTAVPEYSSMFNSRLPDMSELVFSNYTASQCLAKCSAMNTYPDGVCSWFDYDHVDHVCYTARPFLTGNESLSDESLNALMLPSVRNDHFRRSIVIGCTDPTATNFNRNANIDNGECTYVTECPVDPFDDDCGNHRRYGTCVPDADGKGIHCSCYGQFFGEDCTEVDSYEIYTDHVFVGFEDVPLGPNMSISDCMQECGSRNTFPGGLCRSFNYDADMGNCILSFNTSIQSGIPLSPSLVYDHFLRTDIILGCRDARAVNYDPLATIDDRTSCQYTCPTDPSEDECGKRATYGHCDELADGSIMCTCYYSFFGDHCEMYPSYTVLWDTRLPGFNDIVMPNVTVEACLQACSSPLPDEKVCRSVDYEPTTQNCFLSFDTSETAGIPLLFSGTFDHFVRTVASGCTDADAVNYDHVAIDDDGSCVYDYSCPIDPSMDPCGEYGTCHDDGGGFAYCVCVGEFTGAYCDKFPGFDSFLYHHLVVPITRTELIDNGTIATLQNATADECLASCLEMTGNSSACWGVEVDRDSQTCYLWLARPSVFNGTVTNDTDRYDWFSRTAGVGCTAPGAVNYDPSAVLNDGSCAFEDLCSTYPPDYCHRYGECVLDESGYAGCECDSEEIHGDTCSTIDGFVVRFNRRLPGRNDLVRTSVSVDECLQECRNMSGFNIHNETAATDVCLSVDYDAELRICYISFSSRYTDFGTSASPPALVSDPSYDYFEKVVVNGCLNPKAANFMPNATVHNHTSCETSTADLCPILPQDDPCGNGQRYGHCVTDRTDPWEPIRACNCSGHFHGDFCEEHPDFDVYWSRSIGGPYYATLYGHSIESCLRMCMETLESHTEALCLSVDYRSDGQICMMSSRSHLTDGIELQTSGVIDYFRRTSLCSTRSSPCSPLSHCVDNDLGSSSCVCDEIFNSTIHSGGSATGNHCIEAPGYVVTPSVTVAGESYEEHLEETMWSCRERCNEHAYCRSFSFESTTSVCSLYSTTLTSTSNAVQSSHTLFYERKLPSGPEGFIEYLNRAFPYHTIAVHESQQLQSCADMCVNNTHKVCYGFDYGIHGNGLCLLKGKVDDLDTFFDIAHDMRTELKVYTGYFDFYLRESMDGVPHPSSSEVQDEGNSTSLPVSMGCTNASAINFDSNAVVPDSSCLFPIEGCALATAQNYNPLVTQHVSGSCVPRLHGCTNHHAVNYNPEANTPMNSLCEYDGVANSTGGPVHVATLGCLNTSALNFNPVADQEDGSCIFRPVSLTWPYEEYFGDSILGCMDTLAQNYDPLATVHNTSTCIYEGCMSSDALNFDATATRHASSACQWPTYGCMDPSSPSFNPNATASNGYCSIPAVYGCTSSDALNYNPWANANDGSCVHVGAPGVVYCGAPNALNYHPASRWNDTTGQSCVFEDPSNPGSVVTQWFCSDPSASNYHANSSSPASIDACIYPGCTYTDAENFSPLANQDDGTCVVYGCMDSTAANYSPFATVNDGTCEFSLGDGFFGPQGLPDSSGCTDFLATNYDPAAVREDGSCLYISVVGCTSPSAWNYNAQATIDDGSCILVITGCLDHRARNYNAFANLDTGYSCEYNFTEGDYGVGCLDDSASNYDSSATVDCLTCCSYGELAACLDPTALTYNATARYHNQSMCLYGGEEEPSAWESIVDGAVKGCMSTMALNYNPAATIPSMCLLNATVTCHNSSALNYRSGEDTIGCPDDRCCVFPRTGCMDEGALNYDENAVLNCSDCCVPVRIGCMIPWMHNYDPLATVNCLCSANPLLVAEFQYDASFPAFSASSHGADVTRYTGWTRGELLFASRDSCNPWTEASLVPNSNLPSRQPLDGNTFAELPIWVGERYPPLDAILYTEFYHSELIGIGTNATELIGCTNPLSPYYSGAAIIEDGSCETGTSLPECCSHPAATNFNSDCRRPDWAVCTFVGCGDWRAANFEPVVLVNGTRDDSLCVYSTSGCTDSTAVNFNPLAEMDDGSCIPSLPGCMDTQYSSFNPAASVHDAAQCIVWITGCMDSTYPNFNPAATVDTVPSMCTDHVSCLDPSALNYDPRGVKHNASACIPSIRGCTLSLAGNYDPEANVDDGSCLVPKEGCLDPSAVNYDTLASNACAENACCEYAVFGCTDDRYLEYNPNATAPCTECCQHPTKYGCTVEGRPLYDPLSTHMCVSGSVAECCGQYVCALEESHRRSDRAVEYQGFEVHDYTKNALVGGAAATKPWMVHSTAHCEFWQRAEVGCTETGYANYHPSHVQGNPASSECRDCSYGCMVDTAQNYDPAATCPDRYLPLWTSLWDSNDGVCIATMSGCMDPERVGYRPWYNTNSPTECGDVIVGGCMDTRAYNYNELANAHSAAQCRFTAQCSDSMALNFNPAYEGISSAECRYPI